MIRIFQTASLAILAVVSTACGGNEFQSSLHPASGEARTMAELWWIMAAVYGAVFIGTLSLAAVALLKKPQEGEEPRPPGGPVRFVVVAGLVVPALVLLGMLVLSLRASTSLRSPETSMTVEVIAHQWWWEVRYPDEGIVTANEIRIPVGVPVRLDLTSADVIHSFWVPNLQGKIDMFPDHVSRLWLHSEREGVFRGACAELCGDQHALMGLEVVVMAPDEFETWVDERASVSEKPVSRGRDLFFSAGCAACHAIEGTGARATIGPDLTHLAERRNLAAAHLPVTPATLTRWISEPQTVKPGNLMPPTDLEPDELKALVEFLLPPED